MVCYNSSSVVMDSQEKYEKTKMLLIEAVGKDYNLEELKNYFRNDIDSPRTLKQIKSLAELIEILEERDVLNFQCPLPLLYIGQIIKNEDAMNYVNVYKRRYLKEKDTICLCGWQLDYHPSSTKNHCCLKINDNSDNDISTLQKQTNHDLMEAIKNVSDRISHWRVLTSHLNIFEYQINQIYKKHPNDKRKQAYEALLVWMKNDKENATIERLDKALNSRLCRKKGIGSHLRMPLANVVD